MFVGQKKDAEGVKGCEFQLCTGTGVTVRVPVQKTLARHRLGDTQPAGERDGDVCASFFGWPQHNLKRPNFRSFPVSKWGHKITNNFEHLEGAFNFITQTLKIKVSPAA